MKDVLCAELPADLANELISKGFEEFFASRGLLTDAGTVVTVASAGVAVGANVATILVSREALGQFAAAIRDWVLRKAAGRPDGEVTIEISAARGNEETQLRLKVTSKNGTPQIDTAALTAFITSLFPDQRSGPTGISPQHQPRLQAPSSAAPFRRIRWEDGRLVMWASTRQGGDPTDGGRTDRVLR